MACIWGLQPTISAQKTHLQNIEQINGFLNVLFDEEVMPESVVDSFLYTAVYIDETTHKSIDGRKNAIDHINATRKEINNDSGWMLPGKKVADLKERNVLPLSECKELDHLGVSDKKELPNIYVLLSEDKEEILQYFLIKKGKIHSFALFVKDGLGSFYAYNPDSA